ncbi:hypothetical protein EDD85DRAFT_956044 [Armillaria nabsnona]|nr:hypothetical protein EDD85DRAFT_956044 [Armillaria nabsnona]
MSASETATQYSTAETSAGGQLVGRSNEGAVAPKEALKLRLDLNLEVEIAIQARVNGDITLSLLKCALGLGGHKSDAEIDVLGKIYH